MASNKPEVSLGSNGDKHEKAIQDGDEDKLLELREDEKDRGGVDTVDKAKRPESIPIPVMGSPKSPPSSPRQELLQEPVQRKREDSRTEVERQENAAALKTDKSPSRRRKERSPIPADWISEKKLRTSQPTEVCSDNFISSCSAAWCIPKIKKNGLSIHFFIVRNFVLTYLLTPKLFIQQFFFVRF